jgi:dihydrolipoamide dehydrogenase
MSNIVEVLVPDIGNFESVDVIEVLVKVGDVIAVEDSLITVESDKASMDIPSSVAGTVKEVKVSVGDKVAKGSLMLLVEAIASTVSAPAQVAVAQTAAVQATPVQTAPAQTTGLAV